MLEKNNLTWLEKEQPTTILQLTNNINTNKNMRKRMQTYTFLAIYMSR